MADSRRDPPKRDRYRQGHVFWMPPGATWLNHDKPRPYVLGSDCEASGFGTLVYGSTRETERSASAATVEVRPRSSGVRRNGLRARTLFYPGILSVIPHAALPLPAGILSNETADLRDALRHALGIGTGTSGDRSAPGHSWRGRIVVLDPALEGWFETRHAVVVTEHHYSARERYQAIVPIVRGDGTDADPATLRVPRRAWFEIFRQPTFSAILAAPVIQSVWHASDIAAATPFVIDDESLHRLEERLCAIFHLDAPRPA